MKKCFTLVYLACAAVATNAQSEMPTFHKTEIGDTGCSYYAPSDSVAFELTYSEDSSEVWTASVESGDFMYELICVAFAEPIGETTDQFDELSMGYLEFLKGAFEIVSSKGYVKGHILYSHMEASGVIDFWTDKEGNQWRVESWTDSNYMGVLFIWGKEDVGQEIADVYMKGFRFPN